MNESYRTHTCGELRENHIGEKVKLSGWAAAFRDHGGVLFLDLRDAYGVTQVVLHKTELLNGVTRETVISITGEVVPREAETVNPKISTGWVEVQANTLQMLSAPCVPLPFELDEWGGAKPREELRLQYRYLDLRTERMHENLRLRAALVKQLRETMDRLGFLEVTTPILTASSPEGARDYLVPSRKFKGKFYALPQAPQQFKQLLMASGIDRYYQIAPCFRDEDARNDRSPGEFYQLDFEMAFATQEDVFEVTETLLYDVFKAFGDPENKGLVNAPHFPRIAYNECMLRYGTDKPDLRNPLKITDLTAFFADVPFKPFQGKPVRAIQAPGCAKQSKSFFADLLTFATGIGMAGLGYISADTKQSEDGSYALKGPIVKFLSEEKRSAFCSIFKLKADDTVFFISDRPKLVNKLAGQVRTELGKRLQLIEKNRFALCFVVDFPMYEINEETNKLDFTHNPFSMPQGGLDALENKNPLEILAYQYDIVVNGVELSSGAVRNHIPALMEKAFGLVGYSAEEVQKRFGALYTAFQYGAPPHAGMAPGIDRMLMLLAHEDSIREVIAFPMNGSAQDVMMGAPGDVNENQLRETHIKIR